MEWIIIRRDYLLSIVVIIEWKFDLGMFFKEVIES